ncbi:MAG: phosphotransferase [Lachnospiraceae bacterium]|nr:phosphotransferase [Lachnospiraceae bacterium]
MDSKICDGKLYIYLKGRISSENSSDMEKEAEAIINKNPNMETVIDVNELIYISSAGLRVLLRLKKEIKGDVIIVNASPEIYDIFEVTGFSDIFDVKKKLRNISIDGCEIIGEGAVGTVYRIDEDTIVKVYKEGISMEEINRENEMAKKAFLMGIPTAISYDVVTVGNSYGTVFEMIKADNYNELIRENPEDKERIVREYAMFLKKIHSVDMTGTILPDMRDIFVSFINEIGDILPKDLSDKLIRLIKDMPSCMRVVHGDVQMKNVMYDGKEPLLIDMDSLSVGNPVFELQGLYISYKLYEEDEEGNTFKFLGITKEMADYIYDKTMEYYFEGKSEDEKRDAEIKIRIVAYIRFLHLVAVRNIGLPSLKDIRVEHTISHLYENLMKVTNLQI